MKTAQKVIHLIAKRYLKKERHSDKKPIIIIIIIIITGIIPKSLSQSLKRVNPHPNTYIQMQTVVIVGTCSIVRNFLNYT
jgi:hypothetical protein